MRVLAAGGLMQRAWGACRPYGRGAPRMRCSTKHPASDRSRQELSCLLFHACAVCSWWCARLMHACMCLMALAKHVWPWRRAAQKGRLSLDAAEQDRGADGEEPADEEEEEEGDEEDEEEADHGMAPPLSAPLPVAQHPVAPSRRTRCAPPTAHAVSRHAWHVCFASRSRP